MPIPALARSSATDLLPGFWVETPHRQTLPHRRDRTESRWWERLTRGAKYEIITSPAGHGLVYVELRIRHLRRTGRLRWSAPHRRYSALCGGAPGVKRFLTELRRQGLPVAESRIDEMTRSVHGAADLERWPGLILEAAGG